MRKYSSAKKIAKAWDLRTKFTTHAYAVATRYAQHQETLLMHDRNPKVLQELLKISPANSGLFSLGDNEGVLLTALRDESDVLLDLSYAYLYKANLFHVCLRGNKLFHANLNGAHLGWADLYGADLRKADLRNTKSLTKEQIEFAIIDEDTQLDEKFYDLKQEMLVKKKQHASPSIEITHTMP